jgi:hypothetical protein
MNRIRTSGTPWQERQLEMARLFLFAIRFQSKDLLGRQPTAEEIAELLRRADAELKEET